MEGSGRAIERKVITALFCDVVGSTDLGERLDPEDIDRLMSRYHALARRRIEANGGTVEKFIGDAVVGVFGAPLVHEDDPSRAVRAALAILRDLEASGLGLQVRIGLQTGEAVVRVDADRTPEEGLATGDILNTAARLQGAAPVGGIAAGEPTYHLTVDEFDWDDLGEATLKGKALPVHVWRPLRGRRSEGAAAAAEEATPFLGREAELATLLQAFERSRTGPSVELATIVAEPGMGKSRLVRELGRRIVGAGDVTWRKGRCLPYGDGVSFWALGEIVKTHAGILETDDDATIGAKLDAAILETDPPTHAWLHDRLAPLVGLHTPAEPPPQEEAFSAWTRFLTSLASDGPAVLVFEDLHWADKALVDFLAHLSALADPVALLLVVTARPTVTERHPEWLERAAEATLVQLVSLDDEAIRSLVGATLAGASDALLATVLERAAGSPLYAEQLVALARERATAGAEITLDESAVPMTLQALLGARIDSLAPELKPTLLDASVIGRVFWSGAVAALESAEPGAIEAHLEDLARRELTRQHEPSTMVGEAEYGFWHALLRDVAYSFLPRAARLAKHRAAAAWITERAGAGLGDLAEIVADHLRRAAELAEATGAEEELPAIRSDLAAALLAAAAHTMRIEPRRAAEQLRAALELLGPDDPRRAAALATLARAQVARREPAAAAVSFEAAAAWHRDHGNPLAAANLAYAHAVALASAGDAGRARAVRDAARPILEADRGPGLVELRADEAFDLAFESDFERTMAAADDVLRLAEQLHLPRPYRALTARGMAQLERGDKSGERDMREAVELAMAAGDNRFAYIILGTRGGVLLEVERASVALEAYDEAIAFAARYGLSDANVRGSRLDALDLAGHWDELLAEGAAMRADALARGDAWTELMVRMQMAGVEAQRGDVTLSVDGLLAEAAAVGLQPGVGGNNAAMSALLRGDRAGARQALINTIEIVPGGRWMFGVLELVRAAVALDELGLARRILAKAYPETESTSRSELTRLAAAIVLEADGDVTGALDRFAHANAFFERREWPGTQVVALAGLGRCRIALGDTADGLDSLVLARAIAVSLRMAPLLRDIDAAIVAAGGSPDARGLSNR